MIAYNRQSLDNLDVEMEARAAFEKGLIPASEYDRIRAARPYDFYLPNIFVRIGFFLLTLVAALCGLGFFGLIGGFSDSFTIFFSVLAYAALEVFIHVRHMNGSGVDDALLWFASTLLIAGINLATHDFLHPAPQSLLVFAITLVGVLRYADRAMALVTYSALLCFLYYVGMAKFLPFLVLGLSVAGYLLFTRMDDKKAFRYYRGCLQVLRLATLLSLYAAGNYYVIRELNLMPNALAWLWWTLTAVIPVFYLVRGVQKKDILFLWTGMALVVLSLCTLHYYYHVLPVEWVMILAGSLLLVGVYALTHYLRMPKHGFTIGQPDYPHVLGNLPLEGMIIAEGLSPVTAQHAPDPGVHFGGGDTGGGGAGGQF
jgi:hypothetical protein